MDDIVWPPKPPTGSKSEHESKEVLSKTEDSSPHINEEIIDIPDAKTDEPPNIHSTKPLKNKDKSGKVRWWQLRRKELSRKQWVMLAVALVIAVSAASFGAYRLYKHLTKVNNSTAKIK